MSPVFPIALAFVLLFGAVVIAVAWRLSHPRLVASGRTHEQAFEEDLREEQRLLLEAAHGGWAAEGVPPPSLVEQFQRVYRDAVRELSQIDGPRRAEHEQQLATVRNEAVYRGIPVPA